MDTPEISQESTEFDDVSEKTREYISVTGISVLKILVLGTEIPRKSFMELWSYREIIIPLLTITK